MDSQFRPKGTPLEILLDKGDLFSRKKMCSFLTVFNYPDRRLSPCPDPDSWPDLRHL